MDEVSPRGNLGFHPKGNPGVAFDGERGCRPSDRPDSFREPTLREIPELKAQPPPGDLMPTNDRRPVQVAAAFGDKT